ncbi:MAG: hypothetical protein QOH88_668 [Verrucomicrobiota bacterium]|jgi:hypothetical protein
MKMTLLTKRSLAGFSVGEMMIAVGVMSLMGAVFFTVLKSGLVLSAKNTAVNAAHAEARDGVLRLTRDIHASISVPQLRDTSFAVLSSQPVSGVPPKAAGVSFQNIASGPNFVWKDPGNASLIMIKDNPNKPTEGMRLIIPFFNLEEDITKVTAAGSANHSNVFIKADQSTPNITAPDFGSPYAITYYTERVMYLVMNGRYIADSAGPYILSSPGVYSDYTSGAMQRYRYEDGELHLFKQSYNGSSVFWQDKATVAKFISSPKPFYVPLNRSGSPDTKYVGIKLSARDPKSSNLGYLATAALLDTQIDYRSRLTIAQ